MAAKSSLKSDLFNQAYNEWAPVDKCSYTEAWARWWKDSRNNNNLNLAWPGLKVWIQDLKRPHWVIPFENIETLLQVNSGMLLKLSRHLPGPYGIWANRQHGVSLVVFDKKTASMLLLYGSVEKWLNSYSINRDPNEDV